MVPVRLELQNFLSYGTQAPPLDFERFDVACLSGGNGEGKSALLDAMTWALWGEARKSSGKRKPDDELIRIGSRHMEVTFTFNLEETRYRVTRSFSRSKTGKTTSSELEFQLQDPEADAYRPLTGSTQRETQERIENTLGLGYDTFINSAFLLQGRSDEFTNKSPSQRKEILVSILNLSRYEAMEDEARDRWREAKQRQQRVEEEVERLQEVLSDVEEWNEEREAVQKTLDEATATLQELRAEEKALTEKRADREAKLREVESLESALEELTDRIEEHEAERETLIDRIGEADEVLAASDDIQAAHERYKALQDERDALDEARDRHQALKDQYETVQSTLQEQRDELERRLDRLSVERENLQEQREDCEAAIEERPAVEAKLRAAQAARQKMAEWRAIRTRRERLKTREEDARRALVGVRQQLQGELDTLESQIEEKRESLETLDNLDARIASLEETQAKRDRLTEQLKTVEEKGKAIAEQMQECSGQIEARKEERERARDELRQLRTADGPNCPTCGTELTPAHREEVEATLQADIDALSEEIAEDEEQLSELTKQRAELRTQYTALREEIDDMEGVEEVLATAREQKRTLTERAEALEAHTEKVAQLRQQLENGDYGAEHRRRRQWCRQRRAALAFDPERYEALQTEAAQFDRYAERLDRLREFEERRDALAETIEEHDEELASIRETLDDDEAFAELRDRIAVLQGKIEELDYDPERFQEVRNALNDLGDMPQQMSELREAQNKRDDWARRVERIDERVEALRGEREEKEEQVANLRESLEETTDLDEQIEAIAEKVADAEAEANEARQRLGMLDERLEQAERDQTALEEARDELADCKKDRRLYKHLRGAFGKHGIPSLIIEETLPEIEERANTILGRLTDGRMHVRLETLKEKKSGGTKETLDIIITDEQGVPRPYETFSGGESFRVNFALRVALAQLLAERSGVRVRTLVIDEGFGTQDKEGIERLVEAIQAIREDFAKILVITHLPRLKDAFPVRIEVEKDPVIGSTFELVGV